MKECLRLHKLSDSSTAQRFLHGVFWLVLSRPALISKWTPRLLLPARHPGRGCLSSPPASACVSHVLSYSTNYAVCDISISAYISIDAGPFTVHKAGAFQPASLAVSQRPQLLYRDRPPATRSISLCLQSRELSGLQRQIVEVQSRDWTAKRPEAESLPPWLRTTAWQ